jgi:CheY-like chemotaxis protein
LSGLRVLIVEDEFLVALELQHTMEHLGATVPAPAATVSEALAAASQPLDGALLDVQLGAEKVYPVADRLLALGTPIIFTTGYSADRLPERLRHCPRLSKPFSRGQLQRLAVQVFGSRRR